MKGCHLFSLSGNWILKKMQKKRHLYFFVWPLGMIFVLNWWPQSEKRIVCDHFQNVLTSSPRLTLRHFGGYKVSIMVLETY